jgi:hypothetical protein
VSPRRSRKQPVSFDALAGVFENENIGGGGAPRNSPLFSEEFNKE